MSEFLGGHRKFPNDFFHFIHDYLCVESQYTAGDCQNYKNIDIEETVVKNLFTDHLTMTAFWNERNLPNVLGPMVEQPWSSKEKTYQDAYNNHWENIINYFKNIDKYFIRMG